MFLKKWSPFLERIIKFLLSKVKCRGTQTLENYSELLTVATLEVHE